MILHRRRYEDWFRVGCTDGRDHRSERTCERSELKHGVSGQLFRSHLQHVTYIRRLLVIDSKLLTQARVSG